MDQQQPEPWANSADAIAGPRAREAARLGVDNPEVQASVAPGPAVACHTRRRHDANWNARDGISDRHLIDMACIPDGPRARMLAELPAVLDNLNRLVLAQAFRSKRDCRWTDDGDQSARFA